MLTNKNSGHPSFEFQTESVAENIVTKQKQKQLPKQKQKQWPFQADDSSMPDINRNRNS